MHQVPTQYATLGRRPGWIEDRLVPVQGRRAHSSSALGCDTRCDATSCRSDHWRHDGLAGMPCSPCPGGAICEVSIPLRDRCWDRFGYMLRDELCAVGRVKPSFPIRGRTGGRPPRFSTAAAGCPLRTSRWPPTHRAP